jgi:hypothetical protein
MSRLARLGLLALLVLAPGAAFANIGLPMLVVVWPLSAAAIVPVVALESLVIGRMLDLGWRHVAVQVLKANLLSTAAGIPLAWLVSVLIEAALGAITIGVTGAQAYPPEGTGEIAGVVLTAPWLGPFEEGGHWIVPAATIVLLVPCFVASYLIEAWYVAKVLLPSDLRAARRAIWRANLLSYLAIVACCAAWLLIGIATHA